MGVADDTLDDGDFYYYDGHRVIAQYKTKLPPPPPSQSLFPSNKTVDNSDTSSTFSASPSSSPEPRALARAEADTDTPVITVVDKNIATIKTSTTNNQFIQGGSTQEPNTVRAHQYYVYGLDYIDEIVGYYDTVITGALINDPKYVLQDANYNVTAITYSTGNVFQQYAYSPYGDFIGIENIVNGSAVTTDEATLRIPFGFQGRWYDREIGSYYYRARLYNLLTKRFNQRDPNQTALHLSNAMARNAQSMFVSASLSARGQYNDGINVYGFVGNNPNTGHDPSGMFTLAGQLGAATIRSELNNLQLSGGRSLIDGLKGIALLAYQKNRNLDQLLGAISDPFDFSGIDNAFAIYDTALAASAGITGALVAGKLLSAGTKFFKKLAKRAGGRKGLLGILKGGTRRLKRFFGFGTKNVIDEGKLGFLFGKAGGRAHNIARTKQNLGHMQRLGLIDNNASRQLLRRHLDGVASDPNSITSTFSNEYGNFEIRESLFAGPSGKFAKFESTWQIGSDNVRRLTTVIPFGGP